MYVVACNASQFSSMYALAGEAVALWVFSAAVSAMSVPTISSSQDYQWFYRFAHLLAANLDRAGFSGDGSAPIGSLNVAKQAVEEKQ